MPKGDNKGPAWTNDERDLLKKLWPSDLPFSAIQAQLPGRSRNAVCGQAKVLGLARPVEAPWSEDEDAALRKLYVDDNLSAAAIATRLPGKRGRNAINGRIRRLQLVRPAATPKPKPVRAKPPAALTAVEDPPRSLTAIPPTPIRGPRPLPLGGGKDLVELGPGECKFPVGAETGDRQRFCAAPAQPGPYCADCSRLAFNPRPKADLRGLRRVA